MDKTTLRVACNLNYKVSGPSAFIFNVGVVTNSFQRVVSEEYRGGKVREKGKLLLHDFLLARAF
jgi:hypothetical protein